MKIRSGFVSNSSSSSFIVIGYGDEESLNSCSDVLKLGPLGETEFGWGPKTITDMHSRINFAKIQAEGNLKWEDMLESVIKKNAKCKSIEWDLGEWYYIDHQSAACEDANIEMFDSEDDLRRFLFCEDSRIELDNDNC